MDTNKQQSDIHGMVTNRVIRYLEAGIVPWKMPWGSTPRNLLTKRPYPGVNLLLLHPLGYEHNYFLSAGQVRALNGAVREGEKPHLVVFRRRLPYEGETLGRYLPLLEYSFVYNVEQCAGIPRYLIGPERKERDPIAACDGIILHMRHKPRIRYEENEGYYHPKFDFINVPDIEYFVETEAFYATLFHELVHSTGHRDRLNRKDLTEPTLFTTHQYSTEELVAEIGSCHLQSLAGIFHDNVGNRDAYIQGWIGKLRFDRRCLVTAGDLAQEAVDYIVGGSTPQDAELIDNLETAVL